MFKLLETLTILLCERKPLAVFSSFSIIVGVFSKSNISNMARKTNGINRITEVRANNN